MLDANIQGYSNLFCFVAFRSKVTAKVMAGRSVHLTTLFPGQARLVQSFQLSFILIILL